MILISSSLTAISDVPTTACVVLILNRSTCIRFELGSQLLLFNVGATIGI
jgi:hypothetical protein